MMDVLTLNPNVINNHDQSAIIRRGSFKIQKVESPK